MVKETKIFDNKQTLKQAISEIGDVNGVARISINFETGLTIWEVE